ncbi:MAG: hypothetical protein K7J46_05955 [Bryobacter sp.]|jgi:hypothetical protein|nr:hypothetical protein [Bryobacter sp. CoA8 C33]
MSEWDKVLDGIEQCDQRGYAGPLSHDSARQRGALLLRLSQLCAAQPECAPTYRYRLEAVARATENLRVSFEGEQRAWRQAIEDLEAHWRRLRSFRTADEATDLSLVNRLA